MGKYGGRRSQSQNDRRGTGRPDDGINNIHERRQRLHHHCPPKMQIVVLLENGTSFTGTAVAFSNSDTPKCKIFFKDENRRELSIAVDINTQTHDFEGIPLLLFINKHLTALHEEAILEFPAWLEKYSVIVKEANPYFNLDEIREEFKFKKARFGAWRTAASLGFFDDMRPQYAKFNKIVHIELREFEQEYYAQPNKK
jgi:hypothetical protein